MNPLLRIKLMIAVFAISIFQISNAQQIPFVYEVENTGSNCPKPILPSIDELPTIKPLTDPFEWSNGKGRSTKFEDWKCRRSEIKAEIEHYEIGEKPVRPDSMTATYANGTLTINITKNGQTLTMTSAIKLPEGNGPFPAVIGMGGPTGSLPADIFSKRPIATIAFNFGQVMSHTQKRGNEPMNKIYPNHTYIGSYSAWSWGVSRIIDGLEMVKDVLPIDLKHIAVTGCSFAGKMALFAGAFDERIALTIAQEPGGGGAAAWRVSETLGNVEKLGKTNNSWFTLDMFKFADKVDKLPMDHHELIAMIAPRAVFIFGNTDYEWLADEAGYVSCQAAKQVWETFGVADRFGFSIVGGHMHCSVTSSQKPEVEAFIDKFLLGNKSVDTNISTHPFQNVDYKLWTDWWGKGKPEFPAKN